jgi:hypothetical protein
MELTLEEPEVHWELKGQLRREDIISARSFKVTSCFVHVAFHFKNVYILLATILFLFLESDIFTSVRNLEYDRGQSSKNLLTFSGMRCFHIHII